MSKDTVRIEVAVHAEFEHFPGRPQPFQLTWNGRTFTGNTLTQAKAWFRQAVFEELRKETRNA